ncbi:hypothetical protein MBLNU230_g3331t1 [Neophaeotheca triangularis]
MESLPLSASFGIVEGPKDGRNEVVTKSPRDADETERELRALIAFNQWFIVTYQIALLGVVLFFSLWHLNIVLQQRRRWRNRNGVKTARSANTTTATSPSNTFSSSSSSSTLEGNATPPLWNKDEGDQRAPLLHEYHARDPPSSISRIIAVLPAALMYQPRPIPIVNKKLPSNATTLMVFTVLGLNVWYTFYKIPITAPMSFALGDRSGLLFVANLPWLYILSAKNQPLKHLTGHSYESLNILHRRLGEILCSLAVVHGASMLVTWWYYFRPSGETLWHFLLLKIILLGIGAFACYEILYLTSLASFRQRWYELFLALHVVLQTAALVFLWFHHQGCRTYVAITLAVFLIDRLIFRLLLKTRTVRADLTVMEDAETVLVSADWPTTAISLSSWFTRRDVLSTARGWRPSEHIFLTVPALARKHIVQAHPFTIASAAPGKDQSHAWFNLIVRAHDGFSRDLLEYARMYASVAVRLDGPYGSLHALEMLRSSDLSIIVAGGSGIAVAYPLLWSLLCDGRSDAETASTRQRVYLIWVIHEASHVSWLGQERLDELKDKGLNLVVPSPTATHGRPDVSGMVGGIVSESLEESGTAGVVVSGPDGMNRSVRNTCASLVRRGMDVDVAVEQYSW